MKKLLLLLLIAPIFTFSQDYSLYSMVDQNLNVTPIKGDVTINDDGVYMTIKMGGQETPANFVYSQMGLELTQQGELGTKTFKTFENKDKTIRLRITQDKNPPTKRDAASVIYDLKDSFSGTVTTYTYLLKN